MKFTVAIMRALFIFFVFEVLLFLFEDILVVK